MADLGAENFSLSKLLTSSFQANPAWKDLADATTEVLTKNVESHRRKLARIRDTIQNRQGDIVNDVYYSGGRVEDSAGDSIALPLNTRIPSAKILRIEQNNSARLELGIDYALIEFTLADGKPAYWRMPMNAPQERSILIGNAKMLGFDFFNTALSDEDYQRLNEYISLYWPEGGTENFIRFISFLKNISLEMAPLWSKDDGLDEFPILDARDPNDNERVPAYLGGEWYQTSHVELRYDPIRDVDPTETFEIQMAFYREIENLFYLFAPIILVLERIVATITLHWFVYVGTAGHLTEIWQEKLVIVPLEDLCNVYINTSEPINNDCLVNIHEGPLFDCPEWANSSLPANLVCPANPGDPICEPIAVNWTSDAINGGSDAPLVLFTHGYGGFWDFTAELSPPNTFPVILSGIEYEVEQLAGGIEITATGQPGTGSGDFSAPHIITRTVPIDFVNVNHQNFGGGLTIGIQGSPPVSAMAAKVGISFFAINDPDGDIDPSVALTAADLQQSIMPPLYLSIVWDGVQFDTNQVTSEGDVVEPYGNEINVNVSLSNFDIDYLGETTHIIAVIEYSVVVAENESLTLEFASWFLAECEPFDPGGCTPILTPQFDPQYFPITTAVTDGLGAVHITADINPYAPGFAPAWVGVSVYDETEEELSTYIFFNGAEFDGNYSAAIHVGNSNGVSQVGYFGFPISDLGGITDASVGGPLFGAMLTDAANFVGYNNDGVLFEQTFTNTAYAPGREVVKVLVTPTVKHVISVLAGTDIQIHTMSNLDDGPASTVTIVSGNVSQVAAEWHSAGGGPTAIKIVYLDGNGGLIMTGVYSILDETFHNHVRVDNTVFAAQTYFNMSALDGKSDAMDGRYGTAYLGDWMDGTGTLFYHELDPGVYPAWTPGNTVPESVFSYEAMTEVGYEEVPTNIPVAVAIAVGAQSNTRMLLVVVRRWENDGTDWEPLLYLTAYERTDGGWVKSAVDQQLTYAGDSNIKNTDAIGNYLDARIVIDKTATPTSTAFAFTVVHQRRLGDTIDLIGVPMVVEGCNHYGVLE